MADNVFDLISNCELDASKLHRVITTPDDREWETEIFTSCIKGVVITATPVDAMYVNNVGYTALTITTLFQAIVFITTVLTVIANGGVVPTILILPHTLNGLSKAEDLLFQTLPRVTRTTLVMGNRGGTTVLDFYRKDKGSSMKEVFDNATK